MIDRHTAGHYTWGNGCDGWRLMTAPSLSVIEERMPPGTSEVRHYHRKASQFFYVLRGILHIEIEGEQHTLGERQGIAIQPGQAHHVRNESLQAAEFLVISCPPSQGDRAPA